MISNIVFYAVIVLLFLYMSMKTKNRKVQLTSGIGLLGIIYVYMMKEQPQLASIVGQSGGSHVVPSPLTSKLVPSVMSIYTDLPDF